VGAYRVLRHSLRPPVLSLAAPGAIEFTVSLTLPVTV